MRDGVSTRRSYLRRVGGVVGVAVAGSTAGCSGGSGDGESTDTVAPPTDTTVTTSTTTETTTTRTLDAEGESPADGSGGLAEWLPTPSAFELDGYGYHRTDYGAVATEGAPFSDRARRQAREFVGGEEGLFPDLSALETVIGLSGNSGRTAAFVALGSFDPVSVARRVTQTLASAERDGAHRGHALYTASDTGGRPTTVAVAAGSLVVGSSADPRRVTEAILDARADALDRYVDTDPVGSLIAGADGSLYAGGGPAGQGIDTGASVPRPDVLVASGIDMSLRGDQVDFEAVYRFETDEAAASIDLDTWADSAVRFSPAVGANATREGRRVRLDGVVPARGVRVAGDLTMSVLEDVLPSVTFAYEASAEEGTVTVTHDGGDALTRDNTDALRVAVDGATATDWLDGAGGTVSEGDSVTVDADSGATVTVVWVPPEGEGDLTIDSFTVPE